MNGRGFPWYAILLLPFVVLYNWLENGLGTKKKFSGKGFKPFISDWPPIPWQTFNAFCQVGHVESGMAWIFGMTLFFGFQWYWLLIWAVAIGIKEAFIDPNLETPAVAGSGWQDWIFCQIGSVGATILWLVFK